MSSSRTQLAFAPLMDGTYLAFCASCRRLMLLLKYQSSKIQTKFETSERSQRKLSERRFRVHARALPQPFPYTNPTIPKHGTFLSPDLVPAPQSHAPNQTPEAKPKAKRRLNLSVPTKTHQPSLLPHLNHTHTHTPRSPQPTTHRPLPSQQPARPSPRSQPTANTSSNPVPLPPSLPSNKHPVR